MLSIGPIQEIGPRPQTRKRKVFSVLDVIFLLGTISRKSLKALPPDVIFQSYCTPNSISAGATLQNSLGERAYSALPDHLARFKGPTSTENDGMGRVKGRGS